MPEDYWVAEILSATLEKDELIIRLDWPENIDPENPVNEFHLKEGNFTDETVKLINGNLFREIEIYFNENESEKYVELAFDFTGQPDLRIDYRDSVKILTAYTVLELTIKLKQVTERLQFQENAYSLENRKLQRLIDRVESEIRKEIDRLERKIEFFTTTPKTARFEEQRKCFQKVYEWIEHYKKEEMI